MNFKSQGGEQELLFRHWSKQPRSVHAHQVWTLQVLSIFSVEQLFHESRNVAWNILTIEIFSEVKTNFRTAITIPEKSWTKWVDWDIMVDSSSISSENEHHSKSFQPNYFQGSETFSTTMWSGWKRRSRPKRAPRTSETSRVFIRFLAGLAR